MSAGTSPDDTRRAFDDAAADFTALGHHLWGPIGVAAATAARLVPGQHVLDACCGAGASAIPAAELVGADGVVDAVDLSTPMVGELRRLSTGLPWLRAHQADVTSWDKAGYDAVLCALGIFFFPDMTAGTRHLVGRARPGGRVVFTIWRGEAMAAAGRHLGAAVAVTTHELRLTLTPDLAWLVITGSGYRGALSALDPGVVDDVRKRYLDSLDAEGITEFDATTLIGTGLSPAAG